MTRKLLTLSVCLVLAACNMPGAQQTISQPQAWFDMPLPDTVVYPPYPCQVIAHGASPNGIAVFELSINGTIAATIPSPNAKESLATLEYNCSLVQPGKNLLELRVQDSAGEWSDSSQTTVFLAQSDSTTETPTPRTDEPVDSALTPTPTLTETPTPTFTPTSTQTFTPTPRTTGGVTVERVSTNLVYLGGSSCGTNEVTILARATAPNGVKVVVFFYRFQTISSSTKFQSVSMNSIGGDLYERTLNPTSLLGGAVPFDEATLQYQIVVQQNDGDTSIRTPVLADITVKACGGVTASCSSYTAEASCIEHGCNWVAIPAIVPIYECRNP